MSFTQKNHTHLAEVKKKKNKVNRKIIIALGKMQPLQGAAGAWIPVQSPASAQVTQAGSSLQHCRTGLSKAGSSMRPSRNKKI